MAKRVEIKRPSGWAMAALALSLALAAAPLRQVPALMAMASADPVANAASIDEDGAFVSTGAGLETIEALFQ